MRLVYLSMLAVLVSGSVIITTIKAKEVFPIIEEKIPLFHTKVADTALLPVLQQSNNFPLLSAQGVLAVDVDSGVVMYEKDAGKPLLPASTTKIVTALTAVDNYDLDEVITIADPSIPGQKMGLVPGEQMTVRDLIRGMLIYSANDAAEVLADQYPDGREAFIERMNEKAQRLAMFDSFFVNPSGLEDIGHVSTAKDLTRAALIALQNPFLADIVQTKRTVVQSVDGKFVHDLENTNELLGEVDGVLGVKTGWTENARENLVTYIDRNNHKIIIGLLGSQDRFGETKELINWIFANYDWQHLEVPVYSTP